MLNNFFRSAYLGARGYTLLEAVFALGILVMVVAATVGLTRSSLVGYYESEQTSIATHLGREALEVVRGMRDTNWLLGVPPSTGLLDGDGTAAVVFNPEKNSWSLNFTPNDIDDAGAQLYQSSLANGSVYNQAGDGTQTIFRRLVTLMPICFNPGQSSEYVNQDCGGDQIIGTYASVVVAWTDRGNDHDSTLETFLYDWR